MLLENNAEISHKNKKGKTALMYAIEKGNLEIIHLLLKKSPEFQDEINDLETLKHALKAARHDNDAGPERCQLITSLIEARTVNLSEEDIKVLEDYIGSTNPGVIGYNKDNDKILVDHLNRFHQKPGDSKKPR